MAINCLWRKKGRLHPLIKLANRLLTGSIGAASRRWVGPSKASTSKSREKKREKRLKIPYQYCPLSVKGLPLERGRNKT
jgi:hypothetical protein